jgi:hypothetical protein
VERHGGNEEQTGDDVPGGRPPVDHRARALLNSVFDDHS